MQKQLIIAENIFEPDSWVKTDTDNVCESLIKHFDIWPENARIYNGQVALINDITPVTEADVERLNQYKGPFYVIVPPKGFDPLTLAIIVIVALVAVVAFLPKPSIPTIAQRNNQNSSPNNDLSSRANKARPNARIPDIYGTVRAIPDLLAVPYSIYVNHIERIYDYMCIGRGTYEIRDIRDGETKLDQIKNAAAEIYGPYTAPLVVGVMQQSIGDPINQQVLNTHRSKSVNGQVLTPPGVSTESTTSTVPINEVGYIDEVHFIYPNLIRTVHNVINFAAVYPAGSTVSIQTPRYYIGDDFYFDFTGNYIVSNLTTATELYLQAPQNVSASWYNLEFALSGADDNNNQAYGHLGTTVYLGGTALITTSTTTSPQNWVGPFTLDNKDLSSFISNFVATNGLYKDDGQTQIATSVEIEIGITPIDVNGLPYANETYYRGTIQGSATTKDTRALTIGPVAIPFVGRFSVRARRVTPKDTTFVGQVSDEIKWRDFYGVAYMSPRHFGDVTTVISVTEATPNALSLSNRELNMLVTRKLPQYSAGAFTTGLFSTNNVADILCAIALDPKIGNRQLSELNVSQIYSTIAAVANYFGTSKSAEFCYTFDNDNISFEETAASVSDAAFCQAYRRGTLISLLFEKASTDSTLLLNHRNKVPNTENRTVTFGQQNDNDGIEYTYVNPNDDSVQTFYIPSSQTAVNPKKVESIGVRNHRQAHFHAHRFYNKMKHQTLLVEFDALQESNMLQRNDLVLIANNTKADGRDGDVISQTGLILELSQKHRLVTGIDYLIFLQHYDATVEFIAITAGSDDYSVVLDHAPRLALSLDDEASVHSTYIIVTDTNKDAQLCLIQEREPNDNFTSKIKAINYSSHYYDNDTDYTNGVIA